MSEETHNPAPGHNFVWQIEVVNAGNTDSAQVTVTDTLPISTTLVDWWGERPGWTLVFSSAERVAFSIPTVPAGDRGWVYLRFRVDEGAWRDMPITNTAEITAPNDLDGGDNRLEDTVWIGDPYTDLALEQEAMRGQLVPGGELIYPFNYHNQGNVAVENVVITSTLPDGVTYLELWEAPFVDAPTTPTLVTADVVVWELGTVEAGVRRSVYPTLKVGAGVSPGTVLTYTVEITRASGEGRYTNNEVTWVDMVNPTGTNLRVDKTEHWWNGDKDRIEHRLLVINMGTTLLTDVRLIDTYAPSTTWNGTWDWCGPGPNISTTHDAANGRILIDVDRLDPGTWSCTEFEFDLDPGIVGVAGLGFTNTLVAPVAGDTYTPDNVSLVVARSGPDLSIEKWLSGPRPLPGEAVTFTVRFGNANVWPWSTTGNDTYLTDTLPSAMTFISATAPWDPDDTWWPDGTSGNAVRWHYGSSGSNDLREFTIFARLTDTARPGDVMTNTIELASHHPDDIEFDTTNNVYALPVVLAAEEVYLPLVTRLF